MTDFSTRSLHTAETAKSPVFRPKNPAKRPSGTRRSRGGLSWLRRQNKRKLVRNVLLAGCMLGIGYAAFLFLTLPDISDPRSLIASQSSVIVDREGVELYRLYGEENRTFVSQDSIPDHLRHAVVSIEDQRFYERGCLDVRALLRVVVRFGQAGGASTLTRQLARNALDLKDESLLNRKLKELILGCQLESRYSKDELLNLYLNWIPFGHNAYGAELASRTYFGTSVSDLTLAQSVVLAALPQRPSYFSPYGEHVRTTVSERVLSAIARGDITSASQIPEEETRIGLMGSRIGTGSALVYIGGRTDQVLHNMQNLGYIGNDERIEALADLETMEFSRARENIRAPHFVLWVRQQAEDLLDAEEEEHMLNQGGLTIETTLDWELQQRAEAAVASRRESIASTYDAHNIAVLSVAVGTNEILAYVGNADYNDDEHDGKVDMARAPRQPGSSFKPLVYAAAFEKGYSPSTVLYDVATKIGDDTPQNFDGQFTGLTTIRKALAASRNIPAAKAFFLAGGEEDVLSFATRAGVVSPSVQRMQLRASQPNFAYGWPLALGAAEAPLTEMVEAYAAFADAGTSRPLSAIKRITDRHGNVLFEAEEPQTSVAMDPSIAYEITSILSDVEARPNEYWQSVLSVPGVPAAAKTGTSNKCLERGESGTCTDRKPDNLWTIGYTPGVVTGVWVGNADATPLTARAESLSVAAPIWKEVMTHAVKRVQDAPQSFSVPQDIIMPQVSLLSGELPTECTPVDLRAPGLFRQENAPSKEDPACVRLSIDRVTGLLASDECPADAAEERSFFRPSALLSSRFPEWQEAVDRWAEREMASYDPQTNTFASGSALPLPLPPTEHCTLSMTPGRGVVPDLTITYPRDGGIATYPSFKVELSIAAGAAIQEIRAEIDGKAAGSVTDGTTNLTVNVPRSIKESGQHTLTVILTDAYFNEVEDTVRFRFEEDTHPPTIRFTAPKQDARFPSGTTIDMQVNADDAEGGIRYVEFFLDSQLLSTKPVAPYRLSWPQQLSPGTYRLRAVATDLAGNKREDRVEITITPEAASSSQSSAAAAAETPQ